MNLSQSFSFPAFCTEPDGIFVRHRGQCSNAVVVKCYIAFDKQSSWQPTARNSVRQISHTFQP
jgi:hypothetical protein